MRHKKRLWWVGVVAVAAVLFGSVPVAYAASPSSAPLAGAGAGVLPWLAVAAVAALGVGAVAYALARRRAD
ncbi:MULTISPECIES: hypothetical protein [unclassified Streptomyces]|uniref:hypothetical protein n=1 Tax=unclassified Streptomyces TaxID=2593676 RepID=UPI001368229E|nr:MULTISPECIES: hypothetical protein [unclassified Streptomyces]MYY84037.1 hypothetical protein [Streptomyces sp. SID335]MYZ19436.1 hypothetical protein [Streptomyces sp. SID337]NDZ86714.1 hypothetical protein [Streptomyces sp. SID10115]NEB43847.1 hypothetical protein [Streptomyces sp. SID339]